MLRLIFALLLVTGMALPARAQSDKDEARKHYNRGIAHYNLREYPQAIDEFQSAYRLVNDPVFLYNLGQCHRLSGNSEQALYFYRAYLRSQPDAPNRDEVRDRIAGLETAVAEAKAKAPPPVAATPPPAVTPAPAAPVLTSNSVVATRPARQPVYKKWWLWTIVGVVVAGAAAGIAVGATAERSPRSYPMVSF
jgi:tetratricopeptide (TPR) repeat protein